MSGSGRRFTLWLLPLLLFAGACDDPVTVVVEVEPEEVDSCEWLIPIGIELVNDYYYTLLETDVGPAAVDPSLMPESLIALNARGAELDRRATELECDLEELNTAIAVATEGLESTDPVIEVFLDTVRSGIGATASPQGEWVFISGTVRGKSIELGSGQTITLVIADDGRATGDTGCNQAAAFNQYDLSEPVGDGEWPVTGFTVTDGPCDSDVHYAAQDTFLEGFRAPLSYVVEKDALLLQSPDVELRFSRGVAAASGE